MDVLILTEREIRELVALDAEVVARIEQAFGWLSEDKVEMPPIMHLSVPEHRGDVDIKSAYVKGLDRFAVKIGAGFFDNHKLGLPNSPASVVVVSSRTGSVEAVLLDNAYLTDVRTGAAGAVAAKHLAKARIETAGVIGAGAQARFQARALRVVRDYDRLMVWSRSRENALRYASEMEKELGIPVTAAPDAQTVVRASDVVVTTTPSKQPIVKAEWLHPGLHITAVGADLADKQELEAAALARAHRVVCDRRAQSARMGELHHALAAGAVRDEGAVAELGELVLGRAPGRRSDDEITVCDLTGTGVQDTAIAALAYERARAKGVGLTVKN